MRVKTCLMFAVLLTLLLLGVSFSPAGAVTVDEYFVYSKFDPLGIGDVVAVGGYVEYYGVPEWGDEIQYVYFLSGSTGYKVKVWVTDGDGDGIVEPRQHPNHYLSDYVGPIEPRHFQIVSSANLTGYTSGSSGHTEEFYVDSSGVYLGAYPNGIHKWDHDWNYISKVANSPPVRTESMAYNPAEDVWYAGGRYRTIYQLSDTDDDGSFLDESWVAIFTYPSYGGSHHDGMEYVGGFLWISDMTSDVIGKWQYNPSAQTWEELKRFVYTEPKDVEGMGFGPNDHFWCGSGWGSGSYIYELGNEITRGYPIADAGPDVDAYPPTIPVEFDASGSHHTDPAKQIVLYEWDLESDGIWDYSGTDLIVEHAYPAYHYVPYFSQRDPAWGDELLGGDGPTISSAGCALTSAAMVMAYYGVDTDPKRLNDLIGGSGYDANYYIYWSVVEEKCHTDQNQIRYEGKVEPFSSEEVNEQLDAGYPVIVEVGGHFVVITNREGDTYYINDPWNKDIKTLDHYPTRTGLRIFSGIPHSIDWDKTARDYTATLRVTDNSDPPLQDTDTCIVHITSPPWKPVADPDGPYEGYKGTTIQLDGSRSYDPESKMFPPDHPWYDTIAKYEWDLDYDGEFDDSTDVKPSWTWDNKGIYIVGLRVTDSQLSGPGGTIGPLDIDTKYATVVIVGEEYTYAPTLRFDGSDWGRCGPPFRESLEELYYPVYWFFDDDDISNNFTNYKSSVSGSQKPTVFVHVDHDYEFEGDRYRAIQYWYYYVRNDWYNDHDHDWVLAMVLLNRNTGDPEYLYLQYHELLAPPSWWPSELPWVPFRKIDWSDMGPYLEDGTHPILNVEGGSHEFLGPSDTEDGITIPYSSFIIKRDGEYSLEPAVFIGRPGSNFPPLLQSKDMDAPWKKDIWRIGQVKRLLETNLPNVELVSADPTVTDINVASLNLSEIDETCKPERITPQSAYMINSAGVGSFMLKFTNIPDANLITAYKIDSITKQWVKLNIITTATTVTFTMSIGDPSVVFTVPTPDFSLSVSPASGSVVQGESTTATITASAIDGYNRRVTLSASGTPRGTTVSFSPSFRVPSFDSTMTVTTSWITPAGSYTIKITGTGADGKVHLATYTLKVTKAPTEAKSHINRILEEERRRREMENFAAMLVIIMASVLVIFISKR